MTGARIPYLPWASAIVGAALLGPACAETPSTSRTEGMTDTPAPYHHAPGGGFRNPPGSPEKTAGWFDVAKLIFRLWTSVPDPVVPDDHVLAPEDVALQMAQAGNPSVTWLGHAAFIVRLGGKIVITDPFLGEIAGPPPMGPKRFVPPALRAEDLPAADVMLVSHSHYDHLDEATITAYPHKATTQVIVPLGLGPFFTERGYAKVLEQDWWQTWTQDGLTITTLPAVHASGRGLFDQNETLWASFAITTGEERIWFSGDTALGSVFSEIGERRGPFDLALIAIGAYTPRDMMKPVHANPEEAVEIARAVRARKAIGMHWGTIVLTPEDPFEAPVRFRQAAIDQGYGAENAFVLKIGETYTFADQGPRAAAE